MYILMISPILTRRQHHCPLLGAMLPSAMSKPPFLVLQLMWKQFGKATRLTIHGLMKQSRCHSKLEGKTVSIAYSSSINLASEYLRTVLASESEASFKLIKPGVASCATSEGTTGDEDDNSSIKF